MILRKYRFLLIAAFLFSPASLFSQFTYLDLSLGNKFMGISKTNDRSYKSKYNQTNIQVNGLWRFKRHLGIGMTASIPIRQGGRYEIKASNGSTLNKYSLDMPGLAFDYNFKESAKFSINGRLYGGTRGNFYFDGRISMFTFTENLVVDYGTNSFLEKNDFKQVAPGFSIGMQPHLGKNLYMNLNLSWDFYKFKGVGFKNGNNISVESYKFNLEENYSLSFGSQIPEKKAAFSFNIGFGYFF